MGMIRDTARKSARLAGLMSWSAVMTTGTHVGLAPFSEPKRGEVLTWFMKRWASGLLRMFNVHVKVLPGLPPRKTSPGMRGPNG